MTTATATMTLCLGNLPPRCRETAGPVLARRFGGWTRSTVEGAWCAPDGTLVVEAMDRWEVATAEPEAFVDAIVELGQAAGEHSVYVVTGGAPAILETENARTAPTVYGLRD